MRSLGTDGIGELSARTLEPKTDNFSHISESLVSTDDIVDSSIESVE